MPYGANNEDMAVQVAMGAILPREIENLGTSDLMIIRVRQRLLEAARALAEHKVTAPGVDQPEEYLGRTGSVMIPEDADWLEYTEELRKPFVDNGEQDPVLTAGASFDTRKFRHKRNGPMF
jgi:phthalate 4,5-dioxygenase